MLATQRAEKHAGLKDVYVVCVLVSPLAGREQSGQGAAPLREKVLGSS